MKPSIITHKCLDKRRAKLLAGGYPISKWITFCEEMIRRGFTIRFYEAKRTVSKYIYMCKGDKMFKVRFSNHRPSWYKENEKDCDFFVGVTNFNVTTTEDAIKAVEQFYGGTYV